MGWENLSWLQRLCQENRVRGTDKTNDSGFAQ